MGNERNRWDWPYQQFNCYHNYIEAKLLVYERVYLVKFVLIFEEIWSAYQFKIIKKYKLIKR